METNQIEDAASGRMSARSAIEARLTFLRMEADELAKLAEMCDLLPPEAEAALWRLIMSKGW